MQVAGRWMVLQNLKLGTEACQHESSSPATLEGTGWLPTTMVYWTVAGCQDAVEAEKLKEKNKEMMCTAQAQVEFSKVVFPAKQYNSAVRHCFANVVM